jgi:ubiquinone/menaquinone biosynthesis C-methylase UbiE
VLDLGCGLAVETRYLAEQGMVAVGVDLSAEALRMGSTAPGRAHFVRADIRCLPFPDATFDAILDRFCFHWVLPDDEPKYEAEARRVLKPHGRLLLRTCLRIAGVRSEISEETLRRVFQGWEFVRMERRQIPSDTREIDALLLVVERP